MAYSSDLSIDAIGHERSPTLHDPRRFRSAPSAFPEIDCVRYRLPLNLIRWAEHRAATLGVGAHEVLLAAGVLSAERYCRAFAGSLGLAFCAMDDVPRAVCPLDDEQLIGGVNAGILPLRCDDGLRLVITPTGLDARIIADHVRAGGQLTQRALITTPERLRGFAERHAAAAIADRAVADLRRASPAHSAATRSWRRFVYPGLFVAGLIGGLVAAPLATALAAQTAITMLFFAWTELRLRAACIVPPQPRSFRRDEASLPLYTIIVALRDEAAAVPALVRSLRSLDYPPEKLDIKFVLEPDDDATLAAVERMRLPSTWEIMFAPAVGPRTKPKALNTALPFARGAFTVIYDAEDRPEPDQLRRALDAFAAEDETLVCVQARLTIDNTADGWLAALFTAEYAGQFDVLLPGLATRDLPIPLGGSSNHFRGIR